jgi:hypothetical protein
MDTKPAGSPDVRRGVEVCTLEPRSFIDRMKHASELRTTITAMGGKLQKHRLLTLVFDAPPNLPEILPDGWVLNGTTLTVRY